MHKTRIFIGLTALLCTIAATTTPANGWFQVNPETATTTTGPISTFPESTTFTHNQEGKQAAVAKCLSYTLTKTATGFWTIQNSEETTVNNATTKEQKQPVTKIGPHEAILIQKWGSCFIGVHGGETGPANLSECRLQVAQPGKNTAPQAGLGSFQTNCRIEAPAVLCTIVMIQAKTNHDLETITLSNSKTNTIDILPDLEDITTEVVGAGCAAAGLAASTEDKFTTNGQFNTAGQKLI